MKRPWSILFLFLTIGKTLKKVLEINHTFPKRLYRKFQVGPFHWIWLHQHQALSIGWGCLWIRPHPATCHLKQPMPGMCLCVLCSVHIRVRIAINPKFSEGFTSQPFQKRKLDGLSAVVPRSGRERGFHERAAQSGVSFPCPVSWITIPLKENPDDTSYTILQWPVLLPHDFVAGCCLSQTNFVFFVFRSGKKMRLFDSPLVFPFGSS